MEAKEESQPKPLYNENLDAGVKEPSKPLNKSGEDEEENIKRKIAALLNDSELLDAMADKKPAEKSKIDDIKLRPFPRLPKMPEYVKPSRPIPPNGKVPMLGYKGYATDALGFFMVDGKVLEAVDSDLHGETLDL